MDPTETLKLFLEDVHDMDTAIDDPEKDRLRDCALFHAEQLVQWLKEGKAPDVQSAVRRSGIVNK